MVFWRLCKISFTCFLGVLVSCLLTLWMLFFCFMLISSEFLIFHHLFYIVHCHLKILVAKCPNLSSCLLLFSFFLFLNWFPHYFSFFISKSRLPNVELQFFLNFVFSFLSRSSAAFTDNVFFFCCIQKYASGHNSHFLQNVREFFYQHHPIEQTMIRFPPNISLGILFSLLFV